jgi:hypothetical protein
VAQAATTGRARFAQARVNMCAPPLSPPPHSAPQPRIATNAAQSSHRFCSSPAIAVHLALTMAICLLYCAILLRPLTCDGDRTGDCFPIGSSFCSTFISQCALLLVWLDCTYALRVTCTNAFHSTLKLLVGVEYLRSPLSLGDAGADSLFGAMRTPFASTQKYHHPYAFRLLIRQLYYCILYTTTKSMKYKRKQKRKDVAAFTPRVTQT